MSEFPQFDNAKIMIAASVRHCRATLEDMPFGQAVIDSSGAINTFDEVVRLIVGLEDLAGKRFQDLVVASERNLPEEFFIGNCGDLGVIKFLYTKDDLISARVVCTPGPHPMTFLLCFVVQL